MSCLALIFSSLSYPLGPLAPLQSRSRERLETWKLFPLPDEDDLS